MMYDMTLSEQEDLSGNQYVLYENVLSQSYIQVIVNDVSQIFANMQCTS